LRVLEDRVKEIKSELNADLLSTLDDGDSKSAVLDDGTRLGKATKVAAPTRAYVEDEPALVAWCKEHHPDEVVEVVRPSYLSTLVERAKEYGKPFDAHGEIAPGIATLTGNPYISFRSERGMQGVIAQRWTELTSMVLALPGGDGDQP
jgi:hypothetical protein